ncbi:DUF2891 domain-containing protein [Aquimarina sp. TRL1]|uniref:DUF2891 domain-containing protein n=1 Tax=Aquimarina sp. (strain TRL1) TaxID=2736252 RepID=UPI001588DE36|nr:DUF2891 domain-containing protein [Aquimarina sp. TRL1]QKX07299.1 DUF2891 domain-containing protein [Aquimarina sp. TRL1]
MKHFLFLLCSLFIIGCNQKSETTTTTDTTEVSKDPLKDQKKPEPPAEALKLTQEQASKLIALPLACIQTEYPNKLNQVIGGKKDIQEPSVLHPAFYGCFDWHSSVHGHWSLIKILKEFPQIAKSEEARKLLATTITREHIAAEVAYFHGKHNTSYERTYGWAWLLKLAEELHTWEDPLARTLEENLQPLTDLIAQRYIDFLPKLRYAIRVGEHPNTAFGLSFAWDYAIAVNHKALINSIRTKAIEFYKNDQGCPLSWEPGGYDFLSPCLEEIDIMRRVLNKEEFEKWIGSFIPDLQAKSFRLETGEVSDRNDGKLVHLDGLNFSRAWVLYGLADQYPEDYTHLIKIANQHVSYSLPNLVGDSYEGGHWLGSFAIYALGASNTAKATE